METAFATIMLQFWAQHESSLSLSPSAPAALLLPAAHIISLYAFPIFHRQFGTRQTNKTKRNETKLIQKNEKTGKTTNLTSSF